VAYQPASIGGKLRLANQYDRNTNLQKGGATDLGAIGEREGARRGSRRWGREQQGRSERGKRHGKERSSRREDER